MKKKRSWIARILALAALAAAVVAIIVVASSTDLHSESGKGGNHKSQAQNQKQKQKPRTKAKTYTVQSGDTLTSIAHKTGVPISELQALNPEVDPQVLVEGEVLKLQK
ncbi:MAG: LysM peptidoglycan-binding domain-containing protein [Actinobacteria bacterium]|nr:LysM peptidoglycan-binding domain-containing protein [Actinomycetota bacterium]